MKLLLMLAVASIVFGCRHKEIDQSFPKFQATDPDWATYEGTIMTENGTPIDVEISLKEAPVGLESFYRLNAIASDDESFSSIVIQGNYTVTSGLGDQSFGLELTIDQENRQTAGMSFLKRSNPQSVNNEWKPARFRLADLYFSTNGNSHLVQTDDNFNPITNDSRYSIYKRSRLFTVEGYVTIVANDSSEFFERNTHENWNVAPLGVYKDIKSGYSEIATEPNEGVYIRALAYSIAEINETEKRESRIVFKRIVQLGSKEYRNPFQLDPIAH